MLILLSFILSASVFIALHFGWLSFLPDQISLKLSPDQIYKSPFEIPDEIMAMAWVRLGLYGFCAVILNNLFRLYERSIFFSAKNVNYIRFLGCYLMIDWLAGYLTQSSPHERGAVTVTFTELFIGFLVIFIAWVMDEGRKIQEEQELTV